MMEREQKEDLNGYGEMTLSRRQAVGEHIKHKIVQS